MANANVSIAIDTLQLLEKVSAGVPVAGGPLGAIFGTAAIIAEKIQRLKQAPRKLVDLANDVQDMVSLFQNYLKEHGDHLVISPDLSSLLFELEQVLVSIEGLVSKQAKRFSWVSLRQTESRTNDLRSQFDTTRSKLEYAILMDTRSMMSHLESIHSGTRSDIAEIRQLLSTRAEIPSSSNQPPRPLHDWNLSSISGFSIETMSRKDFVIGRRMTSYTLTSPSASRNSVSVVWNSARRPQDGSPLLIKQLSSKKPSAVQELFLGDTSIRQRILDDNLLQICGIGHISDSHVYQIFHSPCGNFAVFLREWYDNQALSSAENLALQLRFLPTALQEIDALSVQHGFRQLPGIVDFQTYADHWVENTVVQLVSSNEIRFIYAGELYPGSSVPLYPAFLVEGCSVVVPEPDTSHCNRGMTQEPPSLGLTLRRGLRWYTNPRQPFRYPSLQLSFPHLFPRLANQGWTHSFTHYPALDGADLALGDVVYLHPEDNRPRVVGNFHQELSIISGVYQYAEPNVAEFHIIEDGVEWEMNFLEWNAVPEQDLLLCHGAHYQSELATAKWLRNKLEHLLPLADLPLETHELLLVTDTQSLVNIDCQPRESSPICPRQMVTASRSTLPDPAIQIRCIGALNLHVSFQGSELRPCPHFALQWETVHAEGAQTPHRYSCINVRLI